MEQQGWGAYLKEAAQTFGDNVMAIFDRIGELAGAGVSMVGEVTGLNAIIGGGATAAAAASAPSTPGSDAPSPVRVTPEPEVAQDVTKLIMLPAVAFEAVEMEKNNSLAMSWASPDIGDTLNNLPSPVTPGMDQLQRGTSMGVAT